MHSFLPWILVICMVVVSAAGAGTFYLATQLNQPGVDASQQNSSNGDAPQQGAPENSDAPQQDATSGSVTFTPSTVSCSSTQSMTLTIRLPASLQGSDELTLKGDGEVKGSFILDESKLERQSDGTWLVSELYDYGACGTSGAVGTHTFTILDANGKVLAEGSYILTP
jgi:cytoskeletal protein RodZ